MKAREKLRNFGRFLGVYLATLVVALLAIISLNSCDKITTNLAGETSVEDTSIVADVEAIINPSFTTVQEVIDFQAKLVEDYSVDETFKSLPGSVITNVATVCLKKFSTITKKGIVDEYRANQSVYDNLGQASTLNQTPNKKIDATTVMEGQPTPVPLSTSYHYEVDTVDGKPVKVLVKEEKYESK